MPVQPSFFIAGAPKCGTTALYEYLRPHPNVFMPEIKEPHFFAKDLGTYPRIKALDDYLALFSDATDAHRRAGEASVYYLRSSVAIPNIREFNPEARIIAMFRNPVDMVYSLHSQLLYVSEETVSDFETAWRLQERRSRGLDLPPAIRSPLLVQYREVGQFGTQAQRLLAAFPPEQVKLILYDDFAASPQRVYDEVIEFLGLPHDGRSEFPRINENKATRVGWLRRLYRKPPPVLREAVRSLKRAMGGESISAAKKKLVALNTVRGHRAPLSPELREELVAAFRDEVALLGRLMGRDLSHWT
ncbi:MAG: sulfotransferase domain-containing protein [Gemmatimonadales bacterium]|nr:sulfotransferase domain-containing protein [Gemmatimonadales bacterium]